MSDKNTIFALNEGDDKSAHITEGDENDDVVDKKPNNMSEKWKRMGRALIESIMINFVVPTEPGKKKNSAVIMRLFYQ